MPLRSPPTICRAQCISIACSASRCCTAEARLRYLNLIAKPAEQNWSWWGRVIFYHSDVDSLHASVIAAGYRADTAPRDAEWGERFFHLTDPDGHELSFAKPLR